MQHLRAGGRGTALRLRAPPCTQMRLHQTLPSFLLVGGRGNVWAISLPFWRQLLRLPCCSGKADDLTTHTIKAESQCTMHCKFQQVSSRQYCGCMSDQSCRTPAPTCMVQCSPSGPLWSKMQCSKVHRGLIRESLPLLHAKQCLAALQEIYIQLCHISKQCGHGHWGHYPHCKWAEGESYKADSSVIRQCSQQG